MSNALETGILTRLQGGTALTALLAAGTASIYNGQPPRDGTMPWVTFQMVSGLEENDTPARSQRYVYLVKGVASSLNTAGLIADQVDALMHNSAGTLSVTGKTVFWAARETVVRYQEIDPAGHVIGHAGAQYVVRLE